MDFRKTFRMPDSVDKISRDVDREIGLHLELRAREFEALGMSKEEALEAARNAFGDRESIEREVASIRTSAVREKQRRDWFGELKQDIVIGLRGLRRAPAFTLVALLTLAIGIGANTAIFSVLRSVLLRPLPYTNAEQLVQVWSDHRDRGRDQPEWLTPAQFADWRTQNRTFAGMAAYSNWGPVITSDGEPETLSGLVVSGNFFELLGARPALGRLITMQDDDPGTETVVVISDAFWQRRFGSDASVVDRVVTLSGNSVRIIGVLEPSFRAPVQTAAPDVYRATRRPANSGCGRGCVVLRVIGRLNPGTTLATAQADLTSISTRMGAVNAEDNEGPAWLIPLQEQLTGSVRRPLFALAGAVAIVLLIGCVNLANLLLVRGASREREIGVRAALGASRKRIVRQLLTENALLTVVGGALGLALGLMGSGLIAALVPETVRAVQDVRVDSTVLLFTAAAAVFSGLIFGLFPALRAARPDLNSSLRDGRTASHGSGLLGNSLVVTQISFAMVLLVGAGLLLRSFVAMQQVDLGYRSDGVALAPVTFPAARYQEPARFAAATNELIAKLRANPAVRSAELTDVPPLSGGDQDVGMTPVGSAIAANELPSVWYRSISSGYLSLMRMKLLDGRMFDDTDRSGATNVAIVNEEMARKYWPGENAIGRMVIVGSGANAPRLTVVGVVASSRHDGPNQPYKTELFSPVAQFPVRAMTLVLEPARDMAALNAALRQALREVDPLVPSPVLQLMERRVGDAVEVPRLSATLVALFAVVALLLAALGVYGVMAFTVAQRKREIGVRLAVGANPAGIRRLVLGRGLRLTAVGVGIGLVVALALGRVIESMLFGVSPFDVATMLTVPVILGLVSLLASWIPARRAMRLDPVRAMRDE